MKIGRDTGNRVKTKFLLKAFLFLSILIFSMVCSAFRVGAEDPSLWVGEKKKLIKLSSVSGRRFLEISMKHLEDTAEVALVPSQLLQRFYPYWLKLRIEK